MWGANVPLIYYGFICDSFLQITYWCLLSFLAVCCSVFTFQPKFNEPHLRPLRAATFGMLALSTFIPVIHGIARYGYDIQNQRLALQWVLATLVLNTTGAAAYAFKVRFSDMMSLWHERTSLTKFNASIQFPEKWYPRTFDIFGASHQIMHIMVVFAGIAFGLGVLGQFDFLHDGTGHCQ